MTLGAGRERAVLFALASTAVLVVYVETMIIPALPQIAGEFGATIGDVSWLITIYLLVGAASPPIVGRLGDLHGRRRVLLAVMGLYMAAVAASTLVTELWQLILLRSVQGLGFSMFPLAFALVREHFTVQRMAVAQGVISSMFGVGGALGLLFGAAVTHAYGWRATYASALVLAAALWLLVRIVVPRGAHRVDARLDVAGSALLVVSMLPVLYAIVRSPEWGLADPRILVFLGAGAFFATLLVHHVRHHPEPVVSPSLLARPGQWRVNLLGLTIGFGMFGLFQTLPILVQTPVPVGHGGGVVDAGFTQVPMSFGTIIMAPVAGWLVDRFGAKRPLLCGMAGLAVGYALLALVALAPALVAAVMFVVGAMVSLSLVSSTNLVIWLTPERETGVGTAVFQTSRTVGGSLGPAVAAFVMGSYAAADGSVAATVAFRMVFLLLAIAALVGLVVGRRVPDPGAPTLSEAPVPPTPG